MIEISSASTRRHRDRSGAQSDDPDADRLSSDCLSRLIIIILIKLARFGVATTSATSSGGAIRAFAPPPVSCNRRLRPEFCNFALIFFFFFFLLFFHFLDE